MSRRTTPRAVHVRGDLATMAATAALIRDRTNALPAIRSSAVAQARSDIASSSLVTDAAVEAAITAWLAER